MGERGRQRLTDIHTEATEAGSERKTFPPFLLPDTMSDVEKDSIWGEGHRVHPTEILLLFIDTLDWFGDFRKSYGRKQVNIQHPVKVQEVSLDRRHLLVKRCPLGLLSSREIAMLPPCGGY